MYPYTRAWNIKSVDLDRYTSLCDNWTHSKEYITSLRSILSSLSLPKEVKTIAAAGSMGRMEASELSDADLIIVLEDSIKPIEADKVYKQIWDELKKNGIYPPKRGGVFAKPSNISELIGDDVGSSKEELRIYGKRILLLLETQPVYNDSQYKKLIRNILLRYAKNYIEKDSKKEWTFLLNDLLRYFRALCVNYQWDFTNDKSKWPLRNLKLRHSRLIMYSGLLFLLGECSKERVDKIKWLTEKLNMTPLERIAWVYEQNEDWTIYRVLGAYNIFLNKISDSTTRGLLLSDPENDSYLERYQSQAYSDLKANSDALVAELMRFIFSCKGKWSERFFEYLLF